MARIEALVTTDDGFSMFESGLANLGWRDYRDTELHSGVAVTCFWSTLCEGLGNTAYDLRGLNPLRNGTMFAQIVIYEGVHRGVEENDTKAPK